MPDPQLSLGVQGLPINSDDAGSFTRDSDTQLTVGFTQEFPRAAKRRLRGALNEREAQRLDAQAQLAERSIRRDTALAWLELWRFEQALLLNRASLREAEAQMQAVQPSSYIELSSSWNVPGLRPEENGEAEALVRRLTGDNATHVVSYGTEAGQFQTEGYSAVVCGPGDIAQAYQPDEFISVAQFEAGEAFMDRLLKTLCE